MTAAPLSSPGSDVYAVILAGGSGTRFWPKSRHLLPKQLCRIGGQELTMIEITLARLDGFIPPERRLIVTHQDQIAATRRIVGERCGHFLAEPAAKNTANALALAALQIEQLAPRGSRPVMVSLHADHMIKDEDAFRTALVHGIDAARQGLLTLLALVPEYAETGYGYIEQGAALGTTPNAFRVKSFREKPELALAEEYVASKRFYWNAGLFIWRVETLLAELHATLPVTVDKLAALARSHPQGFNGCTPAALAAIYDQLPKISIDHALLEVSKNVAMVATDIGWQDVGSWSALERAFPADKAGNLQIGDTCLIDSTGTTVETDGPFVAALGLKDHVVVVAGGAVLVCPKDRDQDVKKVVEWLQERGRRELL